MKTRNQILVVVTALMLVCSAMAIGAAGTLAADEHEDDADDYDENDYDDTEVDDDYEEPTDEPVDDEPIDLDEHDDQPVLIVVDELTIEQLNVENVYVLVVDEDVDVAALEEMLKGMEEEPTEEVPVEEEPVDDDPVHDDEPVDDEPVDDEPVDDDPVHDDEPVDDDPVNDEPVDDEPVDDEPVDDEPMESFTVDALEAPETAAVGEMITVTATVTNPADEQSTQDVQFRLDGDLIESQEVTLEAGETDDVVFDIDTTGLAPGEFVHMVLTDEFGQVAFIELTEEVDDEPVDDEPVGDDEPVDDEPVDDDDDALDDDDEVLDDDEDEYDDNDDNDVLVALTV